MSTMELTFVVLYKYVCVYMYTHTHPYTKAPLQNYLGHLMEFTLHKPLSYHIPPANVPSSAQNGNLYII